MTTPVETDQNGQNDTVIQKQNVASMMQFCSAMLYGRLVRTSSDFGPVPLNILHKIVDVEEVNPLWTNFSRLFGKEVDEVDIKARS